MKVTRVTPVFMQQALWGRHCSLLQEGGNSGMEKWIQTLVTFTKTFISTNDCQCHLIYIVSKTILIHLFLRLKWLMLNRYHCPAYDHIAGESWDRTNELRSLTCKLTILQHNASYNTSPLEIILIPLESRDIELKAIEGN